ncbi:hypothetical protein [Aeromicrobium sp. UC242_57]
MLSPTIIPGGDIKSAEAAYDAQKAQWSVQIELRATARACSRTSRPR